MKKFFLSILTVTSVMLVSSIPSEGVGLGYYLNVGSGSAGVYDDINDEWEYETEHHGFGFTLDTAVARNSVFNYQLSIGIEEVDRRGNTPPWYDYEYSDCGQSHDLEGSYMAHTFGFGIVRNPGLRIWLGPELRFSHYDDGFGHSDYDLFGFGTGPVMGMNIHLGPVISLAMKMGFLVTDYAVSGDYPEIDEERMFYMNGTIFFRIGDKFHR